MLIKTDSYKPGDILAWDVQVLKKIVKDKDLIAFIKEHGQGPFVVCQYYNVYSKDDVPVRWLYIKPMGPDTKQDLRELDESCLIQITLAIPYE